MDANSPTADRWPHVDVIWRIVAELLAGFAPIPGAAGQAIKVLTLTLACSYMATATSGARLPRASGPSLEIDWRTSPLDLDLRGMNGERYTLRCPPRAGLIGRVVGSGPYTDISSICAASAQAGAIDPRTGGIVGIEIRPGTDDYVGTTRNGIRSDNLHAHWSGSFVVLPAPEAAPPPVR